MDRAGFEVFAGEAFAPQKLHFYDSSHPVPKLKSLIVKSKYFRKPVALKTSARNSPQNKSFIFEAQ
jgi:hypothetical protein